MGIRAYVSVAGRDTCACCIMRCSRSLTSLSHVGTWQKAQVEGMVMVEAVHVGVVGER